MTGTEGQITLKVKSRMLKTVNVRKKTGMVKRMSLISEPDKG
jgi:hypothetical protein